MTTEHLDIDEEGLDKLLGGAGKAVRQDNDDALVKDVVGIDAQITNVVYGASALVQRKLDRKEEIQAQIAERQRQRELIEARAQRMLSTATVAPEPAPPVVPEPSAPSAPVVVEPDPVTPPPAPQPEPEPVVDDEDEDFLSRVYSHDELSGMSNERLQLLANEYGMDATVTDYNRAMVIGRIISAQRRWCRENDVVDPNEPEHTQITRILEYIDVRRWNWVQWVCAVVLGLIALRIAVQTNNWPDYIENSGPEIFFEFFWVISVTALGFFAGGWIGSLIDAHLNRSRLRAVVDED